MILLLSLAVGVVQGSPCTGSLTTRPVGFEVVGEAIRVVDGDGLWVSSGSGPAACFKVRIADFNAPEMSDVAGRIAADHMHALTAGRRLTCVVVKGRNGSTRSGERVIAVCKNETNHSLGDLMRRAGVKEGGN